MHPQRRAGQRSALILFGTLLTSCGGSSGGNSTPVPTGGGTSGSGGSAANSPVGDAAAQKQVVATQISTAVNALSDGGLGASGGGGTGAGLVGGRLGLADFAETRKCAATTLTAKTSVAAPDSSLSWTLAAATPIVTVTRSFSGTVGALTYNTNSDGSPSGETEVWQPGPYWGIANITPSTAKVTWGEVPASGIPSPVGAIASAPAASSGALGSVGFRSQDGSWTGAPVWEVGTGYTGSGLAVTKTQGMTMYLTTNLPTVTAASTAPTVGGIYAVTAMVTATNQTASNYSVLGTSVAGVLPSFTTTGSVNVGGVAKAVDQAGKITAAGLPARLYNPPATLTCNALEPWPLVGWKFSQNVAGLTRIGTYKRNLTRAYARGSATIVESGTRTASFADPATSSPVTGTPSAPYFDENAGTLSLSHSLSIGSQTTPNTVTNTYTPAATGTANPALGLATYTSAPFLVTTTRDLNNNWAWTTKTIASGALTSSTSVGGAASTATAVTTFSGVVFTNNASKTLACVPTAGTITTVITPSDATLQATTTTLRFGSSVTKGLAAPSGVTATVTCSGGVKGASNCSVVSEADDSDYKPSGCNF